MENKNILNLYVVAGLAIFILFFLNIGIFTRLLNIQDRGKIVFYTEYPHLKYLINNKESKLKSLGLGEYMGLEYLSTGKHELIVTSKGSAVFIEEFKIEKNKTIEIKVLPKLPEPTEFDDPGPNPESSLPE